ncbi:MAG: ABC transporter permease subunit [Candidatus Didemnitutus sp.]|nr:ABC transporter permease subunit [Candidatus Didemnitutus sp.]
MRHFLTILSHEVRTLLFNPSTYVAAVLFLGVMGFIFAGILDAYSRTPQEAPPAAVFFQLFWIPVFFMVPLLTMKSLAEERRLGTLETLLTTPVTTTEVVLGKFGASYLLYLAMWACTGGFHYVLHYYARDARFLDAGPLIGGYAFIALSGLLFIALGVLASALTRSQSVAGILCFTLLFALIIGLRFLGDSALLQQETLASVRGTVESLQIFTHLEDFTRGVVDTRQVIFYVSGSTLALIFSILGVEAKLLHG